MPEHAIVFAEDGQFTLSDGSVGNPGCDDCGISDAAVKLDGKYFCQRGLMDFVNEGMGDRD